MSKLKQDFFTSRWTFLLAALGMAIGAGNIWRFPRLAGQYGGSFLIPWLIFLFLWSIPLIIIEFSIGKKFRVGVISSFVKGLGKKYAWMGWFIAFCTIGIMFYYSVVCGWSLKYLLLSLSGDISRINHNEFWSDYTTGKIQPFYFTVTALVFGTFILYGGISRGIERATKFMVPLLFVLLLIAAVRAVTLPNSGQGLIYFFRINPDDLLNYKVWLEALSQSAWSTGAGWGLILTYSTYVKKEENIISNSILTGVGNNFASLIAGLAIIPTVFALSSSTDEALNALSAGNQGLTFIYIPQLFLNMPAGNIFSVLFFLTLFFAAISSLLSMLELSVKTIVDFGYHRTRAIIIILSISIIAGFPSSFFLKFFNNQDWVWGVGLLISGIFFIFFVFITHINKFLENFVQLPVILIKKYFPLISTLLIFMVIEFIFMIIWWFFQSVNWYPDSWWNPFDEYTLGTCLFQWLLLILTGLVITKKINWNKTNERT